MANYFGQSREYKTTGYKRRHYEDVARILGARKNLAANLNTHASREAHIDEVAADFIALFLDDNPRFDPARFKARIAEYATGAR